MGSELGWQWQGEVAIWEQDRHLGVFRHKSTGIPDSM